MGFGKERKVNINAQSDLELKTLWVLYSNGYYFARVLLSLLSNKHTISFSVDELILDRVVFFFK